MPTTDNFEVIPEYDPSNPFDVESMHPRVMVNGFTCYTCMAASKTPIFVKYNSTTKFYCPICHNEIKKVY